MKLTVFQKRSLRALLAQHRNGLSLGKHAMGNKPFLASHLLGVLIGVFFLTQGETVKAMGLALLSFTIGSYIRYFRTLVAVIRAWPMTVEIVDWTKAEALWRENESAPLPSSVTPPPIP